MRRARAEATPAAHGRTGRDRLKPAIVLVATSGERFVRQEMTTYAAALAYRGLLAVFPFFIFVIAVVNAIDLWQLFGLLGEWATATPEGRVPGAIRQWLVLQAQQNTRGAVVSVGAVAAFWAVASGARVLRRALNIASNIEERDPAWRRLLTSFMAAPVIAVVLMAIVALFLLTGGALVQAARWFRINAVLLVVWDWVRWPSGVMLAAAVTIAVYRFAPAQRLPWRELLPGALVTAGAWALASLVLPFAVSGVLQFGVTYGSFSAAIVLLVYLYVTAAALLFGAQLNAVRSAIRTSRASPEARDYGSR